MAQGQAERIFPAIDELLARNGVTYADLTRIAVTTGPGSFTGLRIGLTAARGLGLALDIPVVGVPTLLAISLGGGPMPRSPCCSMPGAARPMSSPSPAPGMPDRRAAAAADARRSRLAGADVITDSPVADIAPLARFAATADPAAFPPDAAYIRDADAKPQEKFRVARQ